MEYRSKEVKRGDLLASKAAYEEHVKEAMTLGNFEEACYWQDWADETTRELEAIE